MSMSIKGALLIPGALLLGCNDARSSYCPPGAEDTPTWSAPAQLVERWRIEGEADGRELLLPASVAVDTISRKIAIIDFGLSEIVVAGLDGSWIGRWGRKGRGPRELTAPIAAAWRSSGVLSVYDPANSKIVLFDSAGSAFEDEPVGTDFAAALGGGAHWILLSSAGDLLAHPVAKGREGTAQEHRIIWKQARGSVETLLRMYVPSVTPPRATAVAVPGWQRPQAAMGAGGEVVLADTSGEYLIRFMNAPDSRSPICRRVEPVAYDDDEIVSENPDIPSATVEMVRDAAQPERPASIGRLLVDSNGRLWVQRDRPRALSAVDATAGREGALHDVFDRDGSYLGEVRMPERVRLLGAVGDLLIALHRDQLDVYSIVGYTLGPQRSPT